MSLSYKIDLFALPFDIRSIDTLRFTNETEQRNKFNTYRLQVGTNLVNFNFKNIFSTYQTIEIIEPTIKNNFNKIFSINYVRVQNINDNNDYYYYHATLKQNAGMMFDFDLELDVIQTVFFRTSTIFSPCIINRTHIDRFKELPSEIAETYTFNNNKNSFLFKNEHIDVNSRYIKENVKIIKEYHSDLNVNDVINEPWVYFFFNSDLDGKLEPVTTGSKAFYLNYLKQNDRATPYYVICCPLKGYSCPTRTAISPNVDENGDYVIGKVWEVITVDILQNLFMTRVEFSGSYMGSIVSSIAPRFRRKVGNIWQEQEMELDSNNYLKFDCQMRSEDGKTIIYGGSNTTSDNDTIGIYVRPIKYLTNITKNVLVLYGVNNISSVITRAVTRNLIVTKNVIKSGNENILLEPKLYSQPFYNITIRNRQTSGQEYDLLKLGDNFKFEYIETVEPTSNKICFKLIDREDKNSCYTEHFGNNNLNSVHTSNALSFYTTALGQYMAQNTNAVRQNLTIPNTMTILNTGGSMVGNAINGKYGNIVNDAIKGASEVWARNEQFKMSIDNMRKAPNTYQNMGNNTMFDIMSNGFDSIMEVEELLPHDKQIVWQYLLRFGYVYQQLGNIKDLIKTRKRYNYIQAQLDAITGDYITNEIRDKLRELFERGIRFWNSNDSNILDYTLSNYEMSLEG